MFIIYSKKINLLLVSFQFELSFINDCKMNKNDQFRKYFEANKELWNDKTDIHIESEFYDNESFLSGRNSLNDIELEYLKDIKGKKVLHLQCHFGQDSISLARMGAEVTATDISDKAIIAARRFNDGCGTDVTFIETDTYNIRNHVFEKFDIVFMSYGVTCWLPNIDSLAEIVVERLKPNGRVICAEFHPMLFTFDFDTDKISYGYYNAHVYEEDVEGTYAQSDGKALRGKEYCWQHSLEELSMPYIKRGVKLSAFREYYYSPYNIFDSMKEVEKGKYVYGDFPYPIPHVYLFEFVKE